LCSFLFSIFLNDLEDFFRQLDGEPLKIIQEKLENELHIFYEIFVILYADDTVILSETKSGSPSNCLKKSSKSFKNIEKRKGDKLSPFRTPVRQGKHFQLWIIYSFYMLLLICIFLLVKSYIAPSWILKKLLTQFGEQGYGGNYTIVK
jgi:hypothetical protein